MAWIERKVKRLTGMVTERNNSVSRTRRRSGSCKTADAAFDKGLDYRRPEFRVAGQQGGGLSDLLGSGLSKGLDLFGGQAVVVGVHVGFVHVSIIAPPAPRRGIPRYRFQDSLISIADG